MLIGTPVAVRPDDPAAQRPACEDGAKTLMAFTWRSPGGAGEAGDFCEQFQPIQRPFADVAVGPAQ